ncbi:MAG: diguanylate cyclase [Gammaproteobacteria bacterium]|nr:diguanylate cyclase [Gammaproteobacteria bacterium]
MRPDLFAGVFRLGVRQKIVLVLIAVLALALGVSGWLALEGQKRDILRETQRQGEDLTRFVSQALSFSVVAYDYHTIDLLLNELAKSQDIGYVKVTSRKGNVMAEAGAPADADHHWILFQADILLDGAKVGELTLGLDNRRIIRQWEEAGLSLLGKEALIIVIITVGVFLALSYIVVRPLMIISRSLDEGVDIRGKILRDIPLDTGDEFGRLARQYNDIRSQLNQANEQLQTKVDLAGEKLRETNLQLLARTKELEQLTVTDPLTGLYNRRHFERLTVSELAISLRQREPSSVLMIDIDHFKRVNDTYGHDVGDKVLRDVAGILTEVFRKSDAICRVGGEEFIALCYGAYKRDALAIGEKIRKSIEAHAFPGVSAAVVTVSIGIASYSGESGEITADDLLSQVDKALYHSKQLGRNRVSHFADIGSGAGAGQAT